jgi:hypothetical protein
MVRTKPLNVLRGKDDGRVNEEKFVKSRSQGIGGHSIANVGRRILIPHTPDWKAATGKLGERFFTASVVHPSGGDQNHAGRRGRRRHQLITRCETRSLLVLSSDLDSGIMLPRTVGYKQATWPWSQRNVLDIGPPNARSVTE